MNVISMRLKDLRDQLGYNQEGMAASVKMKRSTWADWEKAPPEAIEHLARIARHYGVSADYLLGLIDDPVGRREISTELLELSFIWERLDGAQRRLVMDTMKMLARVRTPHIIGGEGDEEEEGD